MVNDRPPERDGGGGRGWAGGSAAAELPLLRSLGGGGVSGECAGACVKWRPLERSRRCWHQPTSQPQPPSTRITQGGERRRRRGRRCRARARARWRSPNAGVSRAVPQGLSPRPLLGSSELSGRATKQLPRLRLRQRPGGGGGGGVQSFSPAAHCEGGGSARPSLRIWRLAGEFSGENPTFHYRVQTDRPTDHRGRVC